MLETEDPLNIEDELLQEDALKSINKFIQTLPESLRTSFVLREIEGKSYEDIAKITETPIGTVRSRIFRARETILNFINGDILNG